MGVNEHFFDERNAAGGHYGQTLTIKSRLTTEPVNHINSSDDCCDLCLQSEPLRFNIKFFHLSM